MDFVNFQISQIVRLCLTLSLALSSIQNKMIYRLECLDLNEIRVCKLRRTWQIYIELSLYQIKTGFYVPLFIATILNLHGNMEVG